MKSNPTSLLVTGFFLSAHSMLLTSLHSAGERARQSRSEGRDPRRLLRGPKFPPSLSRRNKMPLLLSHSCFLDCDRLSQHLVSLCLPPPKLKVRCGSTFLNWISDRGELRKDGRKLRLQGQPLQVLAVLLKRRGELVTLEELRSEIWRVDTFVDFDHSLHNAIARIREALGDSAEAPRYIETLPRRGYRGIIGPIENLPTLFLAPKTGDHSSPHRWLSSIFKAEEERPCSLCSFRR